MKRPRLIGQQNPQGTHSFAGGPPQSRDSSARNNNWRAGPPTRRQEQEGAFVPAVQRADGALQHQTNRHPGAGVGS